MKLEWNTEQAMLQLVVQPGVKRVKALLAEGKQEEAQGIVAKDILGLLMPYREMENEKFQNTPDSLQSAPNVQRSEYCATRRRRCCVPVRSGIWMP